ncbi:MAG: hypothetical protein IPM32_17000 [Ignavibacteriae bacterium]|nr:hypothetical protein [Ignavibacteriota bacterium]
MTIQEITKNAYRKTNKLIFIGGAFFISKIVFLFIPYITTSEQYNDFNKIYYSAAIVVLFGKLGFEFAINRIKIQHKKLFIAVLFNTLLMVAALNLFGDEKYSYLNYFAIFIYSFFYIIANIFLIKTLFEGNYKRYFFFKLFYGLILLAAVFILLTIRLEIFLIFPFTGILWMLFVYAYNFNDSGGEGKLSEFYKLGIAGFIVNAALGFAFIADKYIVNHYMNVDVANAYTFAWGITAPMLYLGNMIEHSIYTAGNTNKRNTIKNSIVLLFIIVLVYGISAYSFVQFLPSLLPNSIDLILLKKILIIFLIIYTFYTIVQYPLNGILFKYINNVAQYKIAKIYPLIFILFCIILFYLFGIKNSQDFILLIGVCTFYLFILLSIKINVVKRSIA